MSEQFLCHPSLKLCKQLKNNRINILPPKAILLILLFFKDNAELTRAMFLDYCGVCGDIGDMNIVDASSDNPGCPVQ